MDLRHMLDEVLTGETDHTRRLVKAAAIISEALKNEGLEATVVGGSAIEIYAPDAYTTSDLDLVVPERYGIDWSSAQERVFRSLGFEREIGIGCGTSSSWRSPAALSPTDGKL